MSYQEYYKQQRELALKGVSCPKQIKLINDFYDGCLNQIGKIKC